MSFENRAGDHVNTDTELRKELKAAGILTLEEASGTKMSPTMIKIMRTSSGEVKTSVQGLLHGWEFKRQWNYWSCKGPGIDVHHAEALYLSHGKTVRVNGDCSSPSPRAVFNGLACGLYHVDDAEGLKALADMIKLIVKENSEVESFA